MSRFSILKYIDSETNKKKIPTDPVKKLIFGVKTKDVAIIKSVFDTNRSSIWLNIYSISDCGEDRLGEYGKIAKSYFDQHFKNMRDSIVDEHNENNRKSYLQTDYSYFNLLYLPYILFDENVAEKLFQEIQAVTIDTIGMMDMQHSAIIWHIMSREIFRRDDDNDWDDCRMFQYRDKTYRFETSHMPASFYDWSSDEDDDLLEESG